MDLVTLEEAKNHLRMYDTSQDEEIQQLITSCSEDILTYINVDVRQPQRDASTGLIIRDTDGNIVYTNTVNPAIKAACLVYIELLFNQLDFTTTDTLPTTVWLVCRKLKHYTVRIYEPKQA